MEKENLNSTFLAPGNKVHFISLGCPRNLVDTEVMLGILLKNGYEVCEELVSADFIIVNTCGFLEAARAESVETLQEALREKKEGAKVIATGCMVQSHGQEIEQKVPGVDHLLGSGDVESILKALREEGKTVTNARSYLESGEVPRQQSTPGHYAYLKIAEGCRKRCAYCIIPDIKGPLKSKTFDRVLKEFRALRENGVKEIILIAQDLGDFGKDQGFKRSQGLYELLKRLLAEPGYFWLRMLYLYPDEISDEIIDLMQEDSRLCPYLDMPIQHINNELLKRMHRSTSREQIISTINKLRERVPEVAIRTSLIVGFPGETKEQYEELVQFIKDHPLDQVGIFAYSQEPGSLAATFPDQIDEETKQRRQKHLAKVQQESLEEQLANQVGQTYEVLVEGYHPDSDLLMVGRHAGQCPEVDGQVILNDTALVDEFGCFYEVEVTGVCGYDLLGSVVAKLEEVPVEPPVKTNPLALVGE